MDKVGGVTMRYRYLATLLIVGIWGVQSLAQYPVGTIVTNDYADAYGRYQWLYLQTESGLVQHGLQKQWQTDGTLYVTWGMSYGLRHGNTTYYYYNGIPMSEVCYSNGAVSGWVRYYDPAGQKTYESLFLDGVQNGPIRAWASPSQMTLDGTYAAGQPDGLWREWYFDPYQLKSEIHYNHGVYDGDYRCWHPNGQLQISAHYAGGIPEGEYFENNEQGYPTLTIQYDSGVERTRSEMSYDYTGTVLLSRRDYQDGVLLTERGWYASGTEWYVYRYRDGKFHGICTTWHPSHVVQEELEYVDGTLLHLARFNTSGQRTEEQVWHLTGELLSWTLWGYHLNGVRASEVNQDVDVALHGVYTLWYDNERVQMRRTYKHGVMEGVYEEWSPNGVKTLSEFYHNDIRHGLYQTWTTNGIPTYEYTYCNGRWHGPARIWHPSGKLAWERNYVDGLLHGPATYYYPYLEGAEKYVCSFGRFHGPYQSDLITPEGYSQHTAGQYSNDRVCGSWRFWGRKSDYGGPVDYDESADYGACEPIEPPIPDPPDPTVQKRVNGRVYDQASGQPLPLASVNGTPTDGYGHYDLTLGDVSEVVLSCAKNKYAGRSVTVSLAGVSERTVNIAMQREPVTSRPSVSSATPRGGAVFLLGVPCSNTYDVAVNWNGLAPGQLRVYKNSTMSPLPMAGGTLPVVVEMSSGFYATRDPKGNTLKFVAVSEDSIASDAYRLHPVICPVPGWASSLGAFIGKSTNNVFTYQLNAVWPPAPFELQVNEANLGSVLWSAWSLFPLVGGRNFGIPRTQFFLDTQVDTTGAGSVAAGGQTGFEAGGGEIKVKIGGKGNVQFEPNFGIAWKGADLLLGCEGTIKKKVGPINLCPAFEGALNLPMVGRPLRWFNQVAEIEGRIYAGMELTMPIISEKWGLAFNKANGQIKNGIGLGLTAEVPEVKAEIFGGGEIINYWQVPAGPGGHYLTKIDAKLYGKMVFTVWVYESTFAIDHTFTHEWQAAPSALALAAPAAGGAVGFRPVSRDFLTRGPYNVYTAGTVSLQTVAAHSGAVESVLVNNVYPLAEPLTAGRGPCRAVTYTSFNPGRPTLQATDIVTMQEVGGSYGLPVTVTNDTRAEFGSATAFDASNRLVCVWQRVNDPAFASTNLPDMAPQIDLVSAVFDPASGTWSLPQPVTDNTWLDRRPLLASAPDGQIMLVWLSNTGNLLIGDAAYPDVAHAAWWNPVSNAFERFSVLPQSFSNAMGHTLAFDGLNATLAYVQAGGDGLGALTNQELACLSWNGTTWSSPVPLTADGVGNVGPRVVYLTPGVPSFVWRAGSNLVMRAGVAGGPTVVRSDSGNAGFLNVTLVPAGAGRMVVVWRDVDALGDDLFCRTWDAAAGSWSEDLRLTQDADREREISGCVGTNGTMYLSYLKTDAVTSNEALCALSCPLGYDLSVTAAGLTIDPPYPAPGEPVTLSCRIRNSGDWPVTNTTVAFYRATTNDLLGTASVSPVLLAGGATGGVASLSWVVPADAGPVTLLAVADPDRRWPERDWSNNMASLPLFRPDVAVMAAHGEVLADNIVDFVAVVTNKGALALTNVQFRFTANGVARDLQVLPVLPAFGSVQASRSVWPDLEFTGGVAAVEAVVDPLNLVAEADESNNTARFTMVFSEDVNGNGLPDWWEEQFLGGASTNHLAGADSDHDGATDYEEWLAGTDPMNATNYFEVREMGMMPGSGPVLSWGSAAGRQYGVMMTTNLQASMPWVRVGRLEGTGGVLSFTNRLDYRQLFLKLEAETP